MTHLLLLGAGFSHNWGAPLAKAVNGSLLRDLHDDPVFERALRDQPFENALADFFKAGGGGDERHQRLETAVTALFDRINQPLGKRPFEFSNDRANCDAGTLMWSRRDAIRRGSTCSVATDRVT